ncbi:protein 175-like isoform X2 [Vespula squamosa]|uniref:Protein 175-like isoform X2 n=1 Tax=Vespula squamosa TaxID=30214 RepID=A0ABD2AIM6_VESSQ
MTESYITQKNIDDEEFFLLDSNESVTEQKRNNATDSTMSTKALKEDDKHSDISLEGSVKQVLHKKKKSIESIEADNEFTVTSRTPSRLPYNFIQSWVNTGYLPYQAFISDDEYSGTSSLNQRLSSCKTCDIPNTASIHRSNGKELCNSSSNCSSVDTAAYILSNTNVKKKTETIAIIVDSKCSSKISFQNTLDKNTFCEKDETSIMHTKLNNNVVNSNVSTSKSALNVCNANMKNMKNQRLEKNDVMKELKVPVSDTKNTNEIYENSIEGDDLNFHNTEECTQHLMEESVDVSKPVNLSHEGSFINSKYFRQKKLYSGRDSPTDIIVARFKENDINGTKKDLHPAFRNSPSIEETQKKVLQKKRKTSFCLNNSMNKFFDINVNNDVDEEMRVAKRQKTPTDIESNIPITSQSSVNKRLFISCNALKEQIKRFPTSEYVKVTRQFTRFAAKKSNEKKTESNTNANSILHNALHKNLNPCIILERLPEKILKNYSRKKNTHIQSEELKENDKINDSEKNTQESNFETSSNHSRSTIFLPRLENINTDIVDSDISTIIIYNHKDIASTNTTKSDCSTVILNTSSNLLNSDKMEKNQLDKNLDDIKLKRLQPVVILEQLQVQFNKQTSDKIKRSRNSVKYQNMRRWKYNRSKQNLKDTSLILEQRQLKKRVKTNLSNISLEKTSQPVIVVERFIDLQKNDQCRSEMYNTLNNDSMHVTASKEEQLPKLKNSDNKLLMKAFVKLEHLTITTDINKLSGIYNSFNKRLNNSNSNNKSVKSNKLNKLDISTDNSSMDSTEEKEEKRKRVRNSNSNKSLPFFCTSENYNSSSDSDSNSNVPFMQCIFNVYAERNQKQFSKKQSSRTERRRMLICDSDESVSTRSRSNSSKNLSTRSKHNQQRMLMHDIDESISTRSRSNSSKNLSIVKNINSLLNHSKTKDIQVNMICSSNKHRGASMSSMSSKKNSGRNNSINENNNKIAVNKDNIRRLTFCTKAYDSDSD